ncbi:flagellar basal body L-ring protein FlgH [Oceanotoga sp. DSM 15011]|uniref:Flagellar L-ring protein FlgH n=1 Tax=Oceanotoga teriensis TaxID=515440 RepID=A0AA45C8E5_9BACT|nr:MULTISPECIES: flagellar basal body L-ring protein FlgH [Oceanotoga]MDN5342451.1 flagellar L-ring protein FlgH [Oceanotoga sp.]MDO7975596.1 flagellar basal body L-ring protein FlgH [Oceanotoga teriensis]PWJ96115.1 flagellar L-ring protein precursor FlgH [Oceanotoga teriensis]UYO99897.1 flagellar basal body L-ring protein FlgH [Oceanotoga sp. DSM 15011]
MKKFYIIISILLTCSFIFATSLWNENNAPIYSYQKEYDIGDIITISVSENPTFSLSDDMADYKGATVDSLGSVFKSIGGVDLKNFLPLNTTDTADVKVNNKQNSSSSQASVKVYISGIISEKNGNLYKIRGEKEIKVGKQRKKIIVEGYVDNSSISKSGLIESSKIANSKIWYDGDVIFQQDPNEPSWTSSLLSGIANIFF